MTIIPRGRALGVTMSLPEKDRYGYSKIELESRIAMMFGGRVAEKIIFGDENITTGAGDDIRQATNLARAMVTEYGFSEKLGPLRYNDNEEEVFLGHSITQRKNVSEHTTRIIDQEVRRIVDEGMRLAEKILTENRDDLDSIANALLEFETLSGEEIKGLIRGEPIVRPDADDPPPDRRGRSSVPTSGSRDSKPDEDGEPDLEPEPQSS